MGRPTAMGSLNRRVVVGILVMAGVTMHLVACHVSLLPGPHGSGDPPAGSDLSPDNASPVAIVDAILVALVGETILFDGSASVDPDGHIAAYHWDFGDGRSAEGVMVSHEFASAGEFGVTLTVTDDDGATGDTTWVVVVVGALPEPAAEFALVVTLDPPGAGSMALEPPGGVYEAGQVVRLSIEPSLGFRFVRYEGDVAGTDPAVDVVIEGDMQVTAILAPIEVSVTVAVEPEGSGEVLLDPPGGVYAWGTTVTLTSSARPGYAFVSYVDQGGKLVSTSSHYSFALEEDVRLIGWFRALAPPSTVTLTANATPPDGGVVTLSPSGGSYLLGTEVTVSATPATGFSFVRFVGDATSNNSVTTVTMNGHKSVTAEFAWNPAVGNPGNLLVTGFVGKNVTEFDRFSGALLGELVVRGDGGLSFAGGIDIGPQGDVFVVNVGVLNATSVIRYDGITGEPRGAFVAGAGALGFITVRFGPQGNLLVANNSTHSVGEYDGSTGAFVRTLVAAGSGGLNNPVGMVFGLHGNLFVVSKGTDSILEFDGATGGSLGTVVDLAMAGFTVPVDVVFGPDGALYVTISGDESVVRVDPESGAASSFVAAGSGGLDSPAGLGFHPDTGHLLVVSQGTNSVLEYDGKTGAFLGVFATGFDGDNLFFLAFRSR